jgi:hypothetical protein
MKESAISDSSGEYSAYVSSGRESVQCALVFRREKNSLRKEYEMHNFILAFNHEGLKQYHAQNVNCIGMCDGREELPGYVRLEFLEAVALLQDAYKQNCRFGTKPAGDLASYQFLLNHDTASVDRGLLLRKLFVQQLTPAEFTHVLLHALRRLDIALLYDLSSARGREALGERDDFIATFGERMSLYTFLKTRFRGAEKADGRMITTAEVMVCTPEEEVIKIVYRFVLREEPNGLVVDEFVELQRETLSTEHPENPLNYFVFCSAYTIPAAVWLRDWLVNLPEVFLTGEFEIGECYKLLKTDDSPLQGFDVTDGIICEFILTEQELLIYASKAVNLARMERLLADELRQKAVFTQKYYLPVRELYKTVITGDSLQKIFRVHAERNTVGEQDDKFSMSSAFSCLKNKRDVLNLLREEATERVKLDTDMWYFIKEKRDKKTKQVCGFIEYYLNGNWLRINACGYALEEELKRFAEKAEFILDKELKIYYETFSTQISSERKWQIYKMLQAMAKEAPALKEMGKIPSVKAAALELGSVCVV